MKSSTKGQESHFWMDEIALSGITFTTLETIGRGELPAEPVTIDPNATGEAGFNPRRWYTSMRTVQGRRRCPGWLYTFAGGFPNVDEVERLCPMAEPGKRMSSRRVSVDEPDSGMDMDFLLDVVMAIPTVLLNSSTLDPTLMYWYKWTIASSMGPYIRDCLGHAMQRWWYTAPDADEVARVAAVKSPYPDRIAFYVAASVACSNVGSCDGDPTMNSICLKMSPITRSSQSSPRTRGKPLKGSLKPEDSKTKTGMSKPQQPVKARSPITW